jgi:hypothetical protein
MGFPLWVWPVSHQESYKSFMFIWSPAQIVSAVCTALEDVACVGALYLQHSRERVWHLGADLGGAARFGGPDIYRKSIPRACCMGRLGGVAGLYGGHLCVACQDRVMVAPMGVL